MDVILRPFDSRIKSSSNKSDVSCLSRDRYRYWEHDGIPEGIPLRFLPNQLRSVTTTDEASFEVALWSQGVRRLRARCKQNISGHA